jgi:hypothetical protein
VSALRVGAALALAALAVLVALLAADVRAWPVALERGDALYALNPASARWSAQTHLGGLAATILGTQDDLAARRALTLYDQAIVVQETLPYPEEIETARAAALNALVAPAAGGDRAVASQARTLQGVLAFDAAGLGGGPTQVDAAIADFVAALEMNGADSAAKFDLELLLRLGRSQPGVYSPRTKAFGRTGRSGAQASAPGHGY